MGWSHLEMINTVRVIFTESLWQRICSNQPHSGRMQDRQWQRNNLPLPPSLLWPLNNLHSRLDDQRQIGIALTKRESTPIEKIGNCLSLSLKNWHFLFNQMLQDDLFLTTTENVVTLWHCLWDLLPINPQKETDELIRKLDILSEITTME